MEVSDQSVQSDFEQQLLRTEKFDLFFCTQDGDIPGILTVTKSLIIFDPDLSKIPHLKKKHLK